MTRRKNVTAHAAQSEKGYHMADKRITYSIDTTTLPPMIPTPTAAALLSVTPHTIRNMCHSGEVKAVKVGSDWRINTRAFLAQFGI